VFTGCGAPTHWCDVHHLIEWINGGVTSLENSALLCERHHTKVHHGFRVERQPDGRGEGCQVASRYAGSPTAKALYRERISCSAVAAVAVPSCSRPQHSA